jgi:hypothetical protein
LRISGLIKAIFALPNDVPTFYSSLNIAFPPRLAFMVDEFTLTAVSLIALRTMIGHADLALEIRNIYAEFWSENSFKICSY